LNYRLELPAGVYPRGIRWDVPEGTLLEIERSGDLLIHDSHRAVRRIRPRASIAPFSTTGTGDK
jgi:hypothetical protein